VNSTRNKPMLNSENNPFPESRLFPQHLSAHHPAVCVCGWPQVEVMKCKCAVMMQQSWLRVFMYVCVCQVVVNPLHGLLGSWHNTGNISPGFSSLLFPCAFSTVWKARRVTTLAPIHQRPSLIPSEAVFMGMGAMPCRLRQGLRRPLEQITPGLAHSLAAFLKMSFSVFLSYCLLHSSVASLSADTSTYESSKSFCLSLYLNEYCFPFFLLLLFSASPWDFFVSPPALSLSRFSPDWFLLLLAFFIFFPPLS